MRKGKESICNYFSIDLHRNQEPSR